MATSAGEEESITVLHESSGPSENNTLTEPVSRVRDKHTSRQWRRCKFRGIGSSSVLLIIIWLFLISISLSTIIRFQYYLTPDDTGEIGAGCLSSVVVFLPVSSLLAEVVISRYKLVRYSLRAIWFLSIVNCALTITGYSVPTATSTLFFTPLIVTFILLATLFGAFIATIIPLAIDQIITGSSDNISAFIQWMLWSSAVGLKFPNELNYIVHMCVLYPEKQIYISIVSLMPALLLSIGLILDFFSVTNWSKSQSLSILSLLFSKS